MSDTKLTSLQSEDLLKEKSLWAVYKLSWKLPKPYFLLVTITIFCVSLFTFALLSNISHQVLLGYIREILDLGISFSTSILGFLIAGFTIFATLTDRKLFVKLARLINPDTKLPWLKHLFIVFMHTFTHFVSFLSLSIFLKLTTQTNGIFSWLLYHYATRPFEIKSFLLAFTFGILSAWLFYLTLLLARFVFNIYHACMLTIAVSGEEL